MADEIDRAHLVHHTHKGADADDQHDLGPRHLAQRALLQLRCHQREHQRDGQRNEADIELEVEREDGQCHQAGHGQVLVEAGRRLGSAGGIALEHRSAVARHRLPLFHAGLGLGVAIDLRALCRHGVCTEGLAHGQHTVGDHLRHCRRRRRLPHQAQAAECDEQSRCHGKVDTQAGKGRRHLVQRQPRLLHDLIGDAAIDADRREAAALRTVDHHQAHQQRVDAVARGEPQRDRRDDCHRCRADRADRGQHRRDHEHDPRDRRDPAAHGAHRKPHQPVDGAVVLRHGEQVCDADQRQEQVGGEAGQDSLGRHGGN
ncbi:hypothetical protein D9M72_265300 [compost metagenome]